MYNKIIEHPHRIYSDQGFVMWFYRESRGRTKQESIYNHENNIKFNMWFSSKLGWLDKGKVSSYCGKCLKTRNREETLLLDTNIDCQEPCK